MMSILLVLFYGAGVSAQEPTPVDTVTGIPGLTIESAVDRAEIYIGDLITYRLTVTYDSTYTLTPPPIGANLGAFDVKDYQSDEEKRLEDGRIQLESRFRLTTFTTGDYIIPPIPIEFMTPDSTRKILISEPVSIKVKSLLAEAADTSDIRDIKGPIEFKSGYPWWYYAVGAGIIIIVAGFIIWWRIRRRRTGPSEPIDTRRPWEIAFEALAFLKEKNYLDKNEYKQFYVELSEIVRAYFQGIYKIPVLDMTTGEFLHALESQEIEAGLHDRLKVFLAFADLVKFAKYIPERIRAEGDYEEAVDIVGCLQQQIIAYEAAEKMKAVTPAEETSHV
nr:hypothetical protein [candidate division Zixibacteria bacterium]